MKDTREEAQALTKELDKRLGRELKELAAEVKKKAKAAGKKSSRLSKKGSILLGESGDPSAGASQIPSKRKRQSKIASKALAAEELCVETTKRGDSDQPYQPVTESAVPTKRTASKASKPKGEKKSKDKNSKTITTDKSKPPSVVTVAPLVDNNLDAKTAAKSIATVKKKAAEEAKST